MVDLILQRLLNQIRPIVFIHIDLTFNLFERVMVLLIGLLVDLIALFGDCVLIVGVVLVEVELLRHVEVDRSVGPLLSCSDDSPQFLKTLFLIPLALQRQLLQEKRHLLLAATFALICNQLFWLTLIFDLVNLLFRHGVLLDLFVKFARFYLKRFVQQVVRGCLRVLEACGRLWSTLVLLDHLPRQHIYLWLKQALFLALLADFCHLVLLSHHELVLVFDKILKTLLTHFLNMLRGLLGLCLPLERRLLIELVFCRLRW